MGPSKTYIGGPHDPADLFHGVQVGRETSVHGEDLLIDNGRDGEAVEAVGECFPQLDVIPPLALVVEAVYAVDGRTLVVSAQDEKVFGVLDLVGQEQANGLE